jgi:uncharacterized protein (DUF736 family)
MAESTFELQEGQVMIFKNEKREKDSHPEYRGKVNVKGEVLEISLWVKTSKSNKKFFSGTVKEEWKPTVQAQVAPKPVDVAPEINSEDLPF